VASDDNVNNCKVSVRRRALTFKFFTVPNMNISASVFEQQYGPAQPVWPDRPYPTDRQNGLIPECGDCTIAGGCRCIGEKGSRVSLLFTLTK